LSLLVLSLAGTSAGCGGKVQYYTPDQVSAALDSQGLGLDFGAGNNGPGPGIFQAAIPPDAPTPAVRPLSSLLGGIVATMHVPTAAHVRPVVVIPRRGVYALIFARTGDAARRASVLDDQLTAERLLGRVEFGYHRRGNVIVTYRLIGGSFPQLRRGGVRREGIFDPVEYNASVERRVAAALDSLG
jgi:hypothetical protein